MQWARRGVAGSNHYLLCGAHCRTHYPRPRSLLLSSREVERRSLVVYSVAHSTVAPRPRHASKLPLRAAGSALKVLPKSDSLILIDASTGTHPKLGTYLFASPQITERNLSLAPPADTNPYLRNGSGKQRVAGWLAVLGEEGVRMIPRTRRSS